MAAPADKEPAYNVKTVEFKGRRVPIMLQDVNGPCPLLAIANVLLLRNQLQLPPGVGEVSQSRLVQMVAGWLLDANGLEGPRGAALSEEQKASLQQNLSDAIALLPKLTTGIDVNLRFHDIHGFEYTPETAVFDLLDIQLVHGWLVDPQDEPTAHAVGSKSYNELVVQLVTALGSAATPPRQLTPTTSLGRGHEGLTPRGSAALGLPSISEGAPAGGSAQQQASGTAAAVGESEAPQHAQQAVQAGVVDAEALSAALRKTLHVSVPAHKDVDAGSSGPASARSGAGGNGLHESSRAASNVSMQTSDSMHSMVNRMLTDLVSDAFTSAAVTPSASRSTGQVQPDIGSAALGSLAGSGAVGGEEGQEGEEATSALRQGAPGGSSSLAGGSPAAQMQDWRVEVVLTAADEGASSAPDRPVQVQLVVRPAAPAPVQAHPASADGSPAGSQRQLDAAAAAAQAAPAGPRSTPVTPYPSAASIRLGDLQAAAAAPGATASRSQPPAAPAPPSPPAVAAAADGACGGGPASGGTSPTPASEAAVREALLVQQFLEGHPSQLTFHGLLALQEGLRPNQLAVFFRNNHFNTVYKGPGGQLYLLVTDEGFQFESDVVWEHLISVDGDTQLVGAGFQPFRPHATQEDAAAAQAAAQDAAAWAGAGGEQHDADLALAMQLQAEEEERVQVEQQRRQQLLARQQEEQRRQQAQGAGAQQQQLLPSQRRATAPHGSGGSSNAAKKKKDKKSSSDSCSIM